ncbi:20128_t:CDS:2, partial [Racocetra fulgida]
SSTSRSSSSSSSSSEDVPKPLTDEQRSHLRVNIICLTFVLLIESDKLSDLKPDLTKQWASQSRDVRQKLIPAITKKLPGYRHHSGTIEKILKQHHKTQRQTATINADPKLKAYNRARMGKNSKVNEKLTKSKEGNAYHSDEEWKTDKDQSKDSKKVKKLVCIDKWW